MSRGHIGDDESIVFSCNQVDSMDQIVQQTRELNIDESCTASVMKKNQGPACQGKAQFDHRVALYCSLPHTPIYHSRPNQT